MLLHIRKGLKHYIKDTSPKIEILSSFTHHHVITYLHDGLSSVEYKRRYI